MIVIYYHVTYGACHTKDRINGSREEADTAAVSSSRARRSRRSPDNGFCNESIMGPLYLLTVCGPERLYMSSRRTNSLTVSDVNLSAVAVAGMPQSTRPTRLDRRQTLKTIGVCTLSVLGLGTGAAAAHGNDTADANSDLAVVRQATKQYHDVQVALNDGFVNTDECVPEMGVHFVHPDRMESSTINPECPEVLLYEPQEAKDCETRYKLVGVEYFVAANQVSGTPTLFGQEFDGPMPGHTPDEPEHYDLHAWVWRANPNGVFAPHNPNVKC